MHSENDKAVRIILIDDHPAIRDGLKLLFSCGQYLVCGEAESKAETLNMLGKSRADLAITDLSLGDECGFDLIVELRQLGLLVLVYSMHEQTDIIKQCINNGANGYVTKRENSDILLEAVSCITNGECFISPRASQSLARQGTNSTKGQESLLSEREHQILAMLGQGESNTDIAAALNISIRTVETHFARIISKFGLDGMKALRRYAISRSIRIDI